MSRIIIRYLIKLVLLCCLIISRLVSAADLHTEVKEQRNGDRVKLELVKDKTSTLLSYRLSIARANQAFKLIRQGNKAEGIYIDVALKDFDKDGNFDFMTLSVDPEEGYQNGIGIVWLWDGWTHGFYKFYSDLASDIEDMFQVEGQHIVNSYARGCCDLTYTLTPFVKKNGRLHTVSNRAMFLDTRTVNLSEVKGKQYKTDGEDKEVTLCNFRTQDEPIDPIEKWVELYCRNSDLPIYYETRRGYHLWK